MKVWLGSRRYVSTLTILALSFVLLGVSSVSCSSPYQASDDVTVVAVTILPQAGFVEAVGGDRVEVVVMVPPGASPHTYEVTPDQMVLLSRASMYAKVGSGVEFELAWLDRLLAVNRDMLVVDCSQGIEFVDTDYACDHDHEHDDHAHGHNDHHNDHHDDHHDHGAHDHDHHHGGIDPHIWLSVSNARVMVSHICEGLVQVDPENEDFYRANCVAYIDELLQLDEEISSALQGLANRSFIVYHPAFGYFARDYGLVQIAVERDGNEPDAAYMIRLIDEARDRGIRVIFAAPQFSTRNAEVIAEEIGGEVVLMDPLAKDYIQNLQSVADALQDMK